MDDFDEFAFNLLEESKLFYAESKNRASAFSKQSFLHAALLLSISSLEAILNGIILDFENEETFDLHTKAFLLEREISLEQGVFELTNNLKMSRLREKVEVVYAHFQKKPIDKSNEWWRGLKEGIELRNELVHPKTHTDLTDKQIEKAISSVIECVDVLYKAVYGRPLPSSRKRLESSSSF